MFYFSKYSNEKILLSIFIVSQFGVITFQVCNNQVASEVQCLIHFDGLPPVFSQLNGRNIITTVSIFAFLHSPISPSHQNTYFHWRLSASRLTHP